MVDMPAPDAEMSFLVSITGKISTIVVASLREINLKDCDKGVANLCIRYAEEIDKGNLATLAKFGPLLLQTMESLQMSPKSRVIATKGVSNVQPPAIPSKLDELRGKRIERKNRTSNLDSSAS